MTYRVYKNPRPKLTIESTGGANLGRCYNSMSYTVTSTDKLKRDTLNALRDAGFLGYGQEFYIHSKCDGTEEPAGKDTVTCKLVHERTGEVVGEEPENTSDFFYYVYHCESRVDSSD